MSLVLRILVLFLVPVSFSTSAQNFVSIQDGKFYHQNQPYYFVGTNYWYGSYLGLEQDEEKGIERLRRELDFLKANNITNLRVLVAVEGSGKINGVNRVEPSYQSKPGKFNSKILKGLDIFLDEISKRNMTAVLFLSNNWEWSGGFLQYLNWNGKIDNTTVQRALNWEELRDYTSQFYSCESCISQYRKQIKRIITRKNSVNGKKYTQDSSIMSWEIANEPRPMRPAAIPAFKKFISETASYIKSLDAQHLVTTGSEGEMGSETMEVYKEIHQDKNIDYLTIHIWPKNWQWFAPGKMEEDFDKAMTNSTDYIRKHIQVAEELNKPLVLEEFGFPRDEHSFDTKSSTQYRDRYYQELFNVFNQNRKENGVFQGIAFWAFSGEARPISGQTFWKKGDEYMGDPPMEEQGLNGVFDSDTSTWNLINNYSQSSNQ